MYPAERLELGRVLEGLPPEGCGGVVEAIDFCDGFVKEALLNPNLVMKPEDAVEPQPRTPKIWAQDDVWIPLAAELVKRGICGTIEWNDIGVKNGRYILGGLMG
eukprot:1740361-Karenia_brevis.AAC.1